MRTEAMEVAIDLLKKERDELLVRVDYYSSRTFEAFNQLQSQLTTARENIQKLKDSLISYITADGGHRERKLETIEDEEHPLKIIEMTISYLKAELKALTKLDADKKNSDE